MARFARILCAVAAAAAMAGCGSTPPPRHDLIYQGESKYNREWKQRNGDSRYLREYWERWEDRYGTTYDNNHLNPRPYRD